jgi:hypothetical protein
VSPANTPDPNTIALWFHYEEIAMHFNGLIMQFRLQLIGGAGALGTAATYLIGGKIKSARQRRWLRTVVASGLLVLIVTAAMLDLVYYKQLLQGAVDALLAFERQHPEIQLSTQIEFRVGAGKDVVYYAYGLMVAALLSFAIWSWRDHRRHAEDARKY